MSSEIFMQQLKVPGNKAKKKSSKVRNNKDIKGLSHGLTAQYHRGSRLEGVSASHLVQPAAQAGPSGPWLLLELCSKSLIIWLA